MRGPREVDRHGLAGPTSLAINCVEEELLEAADFCRSSGVGLEITAFAFPAGLDQGLGERVRRHAEAVCGVTPLSLHGPFMDLYPASTDPAVVAVTRARHESALTVAEALGAQVYVAHVGSVPLIRHPRYRERFVAATCQFWMEFADRAEKAGIVIALENLCLRRCARTVLAPSSSSSAISWLRTGRACGHSQMSGGGDPASRPTVGTLSGHLARLQLRAPTARAASAGGGLSLRPGYAAVLPLHSEGTQELGWTLFVHRRARQTATASGRSRLPIRKLWPPARFGGRIGHSSAMSVLLAA